MIKTKLLCQDNGATLIYYLILNKHLNIVNCAQNNYYLIPTFLYNYNPSGFPITWLIDYEIITIVILSGI